DIGKIVDWMRAKRRSGYRAKFLKGWFITRDEPTADQRAVLDRFREYKDSIELRSLHSFRSQLIDAQTYLDLRSKYRFVSAADPQNDQIYLAPNEYVEMDFLGVDEEAYGIEGLVNAILESKRKVLLVGDFGVGKSMTLRELFLRLKDRFVRGNEFAFP